MNKIKRILSLTVLIVFISSLNAFAVTDAEIAKMKEANPDKPVVKSAKSRKMLMFDMCAGFKHSSIPYWAETIDIMAEKTGAFSVDHSTDLSVFSDENLRQYDAICFNNTTSLDPSPSQRNAIMSFVKSGKGIVGIHAATDNFNNWEEGKRMMGGVFTGHPWTAGGTWAIKITEPDHPLTKAFAGKDFKLNDEIYRTDAPYYDRTKQRVLISLDLSDPATKNADGVKPEDVDTGISWIKRVGKGRLFYCSLGHQHHVTWNKPILEYYLAGIQYAMGDLKVDDSIPAVEDIKAAEVTELLKKVMQYDWDKNQEPLQKMTLLVRECLNNPKNARMVEAKLLEVLSSNTNLAVKDYICRQLAVIGSDMSVSALGSMLSKPETSDIARYALERINSGNVDKVLFDVLKSSNNNKVKAGVIVSLGVRRYAAAITEIGKYLSSDNEILAVASMHALGSIGSEAAADALLSANPAVSKARAYDALLACGQKLADEGNTEKASKIFSYVYRISRDNTTRKGGFIGLIKTDKANSSTLIKEAIEGNDALLQKAAIQTLSLVEDKDLLILIAGSLKNYSDEAKALIIAALAENSNKVGETQVLPLVQSQSQAVRMAAYDALAKIGTVKSVNKLAEIAAGVKDRTEKEAVQNALNSMPGKSVDREILNLIVSADNAGKEMVVIELINAAVARQADGVSDILFVVTQSSSRRVVSSAIRALMITAGSDDVNAMVELLADKPSAGTENALIVLTDRLPDKKVLIKAIAAKYKSLSNSNAKQSFLKVMGKLGGNEIAAILKAEYASSDAAIKEAAFRAMTEWPGEDFISEMKSLAKTGADAKTRILAIRGYLKMIQAHGGKNSGDLALEAYDMAERADEKRMVIGAMADFASKKVLMFLAQALDNPEFKAEAEISTVGVAKKLAGRCPDEVISVMKKILDSSSSDTIKKQAKEVINKAEKTGAFIIDWKISGPYAEAGMDAKTLHDRAFDPERNGGQWKIAKVSDSGIVDIGQVGLGDNRVAYLKTYIISAESQDVTLSLGSDDGVKVWLNNKIVHSNMVGRGLTRGSDKVKVKLLKGRNEIFVKVSQISGGWEFCLEILQENGERAKNIEVDTE